MDPIKVFTNADFGSIRGMQIGGEPWFVGKDIADKLGYADPNKAIAMHVDDDDKLNDKTASSLGQRGGWLINESGLYSLVLSSKLPGAKAFKRWITSEVIPSIRRSGGYIKDQETLSDDDLMARALMVAKRQIEQRDRQLQEAGPKVLFTDSVSASNLDPYRRPRQAHLSERGQHRSEAAFPVDAGQRLSDQAGRFQPEYADPEEHGAGLFEVKETVITHLDGHIGISKTVKVTGKGQVFFVIKFLAGGKELSTISTAMCGQEKGEKQ